MAQARPRSRGRDEIVAGRHTPAIAAIVFGSVQGLVGPTEQIHETVVVAAIRSDRRSSDADGHQGAGRRVAVGDAERFNRLAHGFGNPRRALFPRIPEDEAGWRTAAFLYGTPDEVRRDLQRWRDLGIRRVMLQLLDMEDFAALDLIAREVLPAFR